MTNSFLIQTIASKIESKSKMHLYMYIYIYIGKNCIVMNLSMLSLCEKRTYSVNGNVFYQFPFSCVWSHQGAMAILPVLSYKFEFFPGEEKCNFF